MGVHKRYQIQRIGLLPGGIAPQHKQQEPRCVGHHATLTQALPALQVHRVIGDHLGHDFFACKPGKKIRQPCLVDLGLVQLAQPDRNGLGAQCLHHGDLRWSLVDLGCLAGDLQDELLAHRFLDRLQSGTVTLHIQAVAPLGIADVQMQHGGTGIQTGFGRRSNMLGRQRHLRVVGVLLIGTIGRRGDDEGFHGDPLG